MLCGATILQPQASKRALAKIIPRKCYRKPPESSYHAFKKKKKKSNDNFLNRNEIYVLHKCAFFYFSCIMHLIDTRLISKKAAFFWRLRKHLNPPVLGVREFLSHILIRRNERINSRILEMLIVVISKCATLLSARRTYIRLIFISVQHSYKCICTTREFVTPGSFQMRVHVSVFLVVLARRHRCLAKTVGNMQSESSTERSHAIDKKHTEARFILRKREQGLFSRQKYHCQIRS